MYLEQPKPAERTPCEVCDRPCEQAGDVWGRRLCDACFGAWGDAAPNESRNPELGTMGHAEAVARYRKWTGTWVEMQRALRKRGAA